MTTTARTGKVPRMVGEPFQTAPRTMSTLVAVVAAAVVTCRRGPDLTWWQHTTISRPPRCSKVRLGSTLATAVGLVAIVALVAVGFLTPPSNGCRHGRPRRTSGRTSEARRQAVHGTRRTCRAGRLQGGRLLQPWRVCWWSGHRLIRRSVRCKPHPSGITRPQRLNSLALGASTGPDEPHNDFRRAMDDFTKAIVIRASAVFAPTNVDETAAEVAPPPPSGGEFVPSTIMRRRPFGSRPSGAPR